MIFEKHNLIHFYEMVSSLGPLSTFKNSKNIPRCFLIRHDVDFSVDSAHKLSVFESENNIISTYFFLLSGPYNLLSKSSITKIDNMIDSGFEIGLHFDPTIYNNIELGFKKEVEIFEKVFDTEIKSVSLHNPSIHGSYPLFDGYINAYSPELFEESRYLSDSLRNFRGKDPFEFIKNIKDKPMQIVLHPIYYGV